MIFVFYIFCKWGKKYLIKQDALEDIIDTYVVFRFRDLKGTQISTYQLLIQDWCSVIYIIWKIYLSTTCLIFNKIEMYITMNQNEGKVDLGRTVRNWKTVYT